MNAELVTVKKKLPLTKSKFQERRQILYQLVNSFCWKEESKADFVRLHFLLPLQPTYTSISKFNLGNTEKIIRESLNNIFELYKEG